MSTELESALNDLMGIQAVLHHIAMDSANHVYDSEMYIFLGNAIGEIANRIQTSIQNQE